MEYIRSYMTENSCFIADQKIKPTGIVLQNVGRPQPSAKVLVHNWNRGGDDKPCPHMIVNCGKIAVYSTLPTDVKGRHVNDDRNDDTIGVFLCEPNTVLHTGNEIKILKNPETTEILTRRVYDRAVQLCVELCQEFGFYSNNISTTDATNPEKLWTMVDEKLTWSNFILEVESRLNAISMQKAALKMKEEAEKVIPIAINVANLRIRATPSVDGEVVGKITTPGRYNLSERQNGTGSKNGWGKLSTGEGWVSLDYVEFL